MRNPASRIGALVALALTITVSTAALAQDKVVRILVGFAPGGTADVVARLIAEKMKDSLGQTVIVENRPGATGRIAAEAVKNGPADGSMVSLVTNLHLAMAVATNVPAKNVREYFAWAKANHDKAFYATSGAGTLPHFLGLLVAKEAGVELTHVPYKGTSAYMAELTTGQIPAAFDAMGDLSEQHKAGKVRILASAGGKRSAAMPDIPTFRDEGFNVEGSAWFGVLAPAATPKATVDRLSAAIAKAVQSPDVAAKLASLNMEPVGSTPEEFARVIAADWAKWSAIVKASGFTLE